MNKVAVVSDKDMPSAEDLSAYVESLKLHLKRNQIKDEDLVRLIATLPSPQQVKKSLSNEEIRVLSETVGYIWNKLTGGSIIQENKLTRAPETLNGNYWMLTKGVILEGSNHFTIIKRNISLFCSLLNINAFAMHEKLSNNPNDVIKLVLDHGGMRIFVNNKKQAYFQLADNTYSKWGRAKIKKYNFHEKITKVIDRRQPYKGWKSGIVIKI